ncbi:MAG: YesL family protein [Clostridia bacterium]|nr:YesL family protein [Clostridia bacterium]
MGIFGGSFDRPGKGISKEEAAQRSYFDILGRHLWDLVKLNLLFVACNIVFLVAAALLILPYLFNLEEVVSSLFQGQVVLLPVLPFVPFLFMGPFIAGLTYVLRNWSRQEHAFIFSDFFEHTKKNWKQGLCLSVISTAITYVFLVAALYYLKSGLPVPLVLTLGAILAALLLIANFYTYPMVVTFQMKLKDILKNAWIFTVAKLPQNLFFLLIISLVHILLLWYTPLVWGVLMAVVLISWTGFTMNYYTWYVMDKYMMSRVFKEEPEEAVFEDVK